MDKLLNLIGLAKKAGKLEVGEEPVGAAARSKHARLILIASDAAENTRRRAKHFGDAGECICLEIPATKEALGKALGRTSCALLALTDIGFAEAIAKKLAESDEAHYGEAAKRLSVKAGRAAERFLRRRDLKADALARLAEVERAAARVVRRIRGDEDEPRVLASCRRADGLFTDLQLSGLFGKADQIEQFIHRLPSPFPFLRRRSRGWPCPARARARGICAPA